MVGMRITVIGASGLIGTKLVELFTADGHDVVAASRDTGVDVLTGEGFADALAGADVLVDVVNSPSFEDGAGDELLHHVDDQSGGRREERGRRPLRRPVDRRGRRAAGQRVHARQGGAGEGVGESGLPYTIVRATQFAEFADAITDSMIVGDEVRVPDALIQPIAADEVVAEMARAAVAEPLGGV